MVTKETCLICFSKQLYHMGYPMTALQLLDVVLRSWSQFHTHIHRTPAGCFLSFCFLSFCCKSSVSPVGNEISLQRLTGSRFICRGTVSAGLLWSSLCRHVKQVKSSIVACQYKDIVYQQIRFKLRQAQPHITIR